MAMTIAVTRNAPGRFRGFLASTMVEIVPGIYVAPRMKKAVRERIWNVMMDWSSLLDTDGGVVLFWKSRNAPSGLGMRSIGWPEKELVDHEGVWLAKRSLRSDHDTDELERLSRLEALIPEEGD
jgi:CRISPR-associated protein Cas2